MDLTGNTRNISITTVISGSGGLDVGALLEIAVCCFAHRRVFAVFLASVDTSTIQLSKYHVSDVSFHTSG